MNEIHPQQPTKRPLRTGEIMKFLIPSLVGAVAFLMPIPQGTTMNTLLGMAIDFGKGTLKGQLPFLAMILVCAGALFTLYAVLVKPKFVRENDFLSELFMVSPFWVFSRLLGAIFYPLIYFKVGPEIIWHMDNGGTPGFLLAPALLVVFSVLAFIVPFLTDFGLMEYIGTMARPVLRPLFTLPGRAAVDCVASWVGSSSVGVVITTKMHREGYYSDREASIIATCFSVISIAYIYLMADFVGLPHMYFQLLISIYIVTFLLALLMPRIWPLRGMKDDYSGKEQRQISEDLPQGFTLREWALHSAVEKARDQGAHTVIVTCLRTFTSLIVSTMPLVISWGTLVLMVANSTPIFQWISLPFAWMLALVNIPEAAQVAPAFVLSYADQFLAAVIGADRVAEAAKFMCAGISATGLIYMTEVGVLILNSTIPLGAGKLTVIYIIRAVLSVFLLAPFALYFCGQDMRRMRYSEYEALQDFAATILKHVGYPREKAVITAWALVEADARGVPSHGLQRLGDYENYVQEGLFRPQAPLERVYETPSSVVLDGHNGIGMDIAHQAMKLCIDRAKKGGSGFCAVRNSNHYGMAGLWAEMAVPEGCMGIAMTNTEKFAIVTHGRERLLGTNPLAIALPAKEGEPFLLDMATTTVPHGKIEVYARRGLSMPLGWAVNAEGKDTGDAPGMSTLFKSPLPLGGQLMLGGRGELLGGHKGYGLGLLVELFCAALSGGTWSRHTFTPETGGAIAHFFAALDLRLFGDPWEIAATVENILEEIRSSSLAEGEERIYIHGEKEREQRQKALASGVPLDEITWRELQAYGERFSLDLPRELFPE